MSNINSYGDRLKIERLFDTFADNFRLTQLYAAYLGQFPEIITEEPKETQTVQTEPAEPVETDAVTEPAETDPVTETETDVAVTGELTGEAIPVNGDDVDPEN